MKKPRISAFAALGSTTRVIGKNNKLIWHIPGDLPRFKGLTSGHAVIMGRKTFESIGKALPHRTNIIITRQKDYQPHDVVITHSLQEALQKAQSLEQEEVFIIGGGEIYTEALPFTDRLYLTLIDDDQAGDVYFPDYSEFKKIISKEDHPENVPTFSYRILEK